jgi:hypothetical protein
MELLYLYITDDHRNIKGCEYNFSPNYRFSYEQETKTFHIEKGTGLPTQWFGKNILNITAIIGKNGAGKTNMMECLIRALCYQDGGVIIFLHDGYLWTNCHARFTNYVFDFEIHRMGRFGSPLNTEFAESIPDTSVVYYSSAIDRALSNTRSYFPKFTDISNAYLLRLSRCDLSKAPDYVLASDVDIMQTNDIFKQLLFFIYCSKQGFKFVDTVSLPQFLNVTLHVFHEKEPENVAFKALVKDRTSSFGDQLKYYMLRQIFALGSISEEWTENTTFEEVMLLQNRNEDYRPDFYKILIELHKNHKIVYKENERKGMMKGNDTMAFKVEMNAMNQEFLSALFCYYCIHPTIPYASFGSFNSQENSVNNSITLAYGMSSGERAFYTFFARLFGVFFNKQGEFHYAFNKEIEIGSEYNGKSIIMLLDEAELSMHPEWQQKFINLLTTALNQFFPKIKFQIILASHSPILISDLPKSNIIFLKKQDDDTCLVCDALKCKETFGANIHTLFNDAFFLDGIPIGDFAKYKINELFLRVKGGDASKTLLDEIYRIGEPILKANLLGLYDENRKNLNRNKRKESLLAELKLIEEDKYD